MIRKYFFTNRVVNIWNSLPNYVITTESVNSFKSRLDKFWKHQELMYNYRSESHGTGAEVSLIGNFVTSRLLKSVCEKQA